MEQLGREPAQLRDLSRSKNIPEIRGRFQRGCSTKLFKGMKLSGLCPCRLGVMGGWFSAFPTTLINRWVNEEQQEQTSLLHQCPQCSQPPGQPIPLLVLLVDLIPFGATAAGPV